jgi:hypothetical protein
MHRSNIRDRREIQPNPDTRIVLIRNGVHADLRIQLLLIVHRPRAPHVGQDFRQNIRSAPGLAVQDSTVRHPIQNLNQPLRARRKGLANRSGAVDRMTRLDDRG